MDRIFRKNLILSIEDNLSQRKATYDFLKRDEHLRNLLGGELETITSRITGKVEESVLNKEVLNIESQAGDSPNLVFMITADVARAYLNRNIPAALITDSGFPLNGRTVVEWLTKYDFGYPIVALTSSSESCLSDEEKKYLMGTPSTYLSKRLPSFEGKNRLSQILPPLVSFHIGYNRQRNQVR